MCEACENTEVLMIGTHAMVILTPPGDPLDVPARLHGVHVVPMLADARTKYRPNDNFICFKFVVDYPNDERHTHRYQSIIADLELDHAEALVAALQDAIKKVRLSQL